MELLKQLSQTSGVPGQEHRIRQLLTEKGKGLFDEIRTDRMGSLIAIRRARVGAEGKKKTSGAKGAKATQPVKVMLAAHMDQIGFVVRYIDEKGFLKVQAVGGFDTRNLFARMVNVCPDPLDATKDLIGVMNPGGKPIHIASEEDKKRIPDVHDLVIDLGRPAEEVRKLVKIGDMVTLRAEVNEVGSLVVGQAMDNRVACWLVIRALEKLKRHNCDVYAVFTVQEEVGCRGAGTAAAAIEPDIAISLDTTLAVDTPGVSDDQAVSKAGQGAGLLVMDSTVISDPVLLTDFEAVAKKHGIKVQRTLLPRGGNDAATMQRAGSGQRVMTIVCPTRYIHTVTEAVHKDDLTACRDLLAAWLGSL